MSKLLFAFVGRVSTEEMQEPEASRARQVAKANTIVPPSAQIVADYFDIGDTRALLGQGSTASAGGAQVDRRWLWPDDAMRGRTRGSARRGAGAGLAAD